MISELLSDGNWLAGFLAENNRRLAASYGALTSGLSAAGVPFVPSAAAMFCWVDLRAGLRREGGWEGERALWARMVQARALRGRSGIAVPVARGPELIFASASPHNPAQHHRNPQNLCKTAPKTSLNNPHKTLPPNPSQNQK
jgi:1-aminocyclopropane-1-carboxylate synthase